MLKQLLEKLNLDDCIVLDIYRGDSCVGVWTKNRKIAMSQKSFYRELAEQHGCLETRIRIKNTEIYIMHKHKLFKSQQDIKEYLKTVPDNSKFFIYSQGRSYPASQNLFVKIDFAWLKFRADYSMVDQPPSTIQGSLEIIPSDTPDMVLVDWRDEHMMYPQYHYNIKPSDIEVLDESHITAELL